MSDKDSTDRISRCHHGSAFATDWCQADACRDSLREHMALLKAAYEKIERLENNRIDEIVVGDRRIVDGEPEGTILGISHWDKRIIEEGHDGKWCQIIVRPINPLTR